jgi:putative membrane protein
MPARHLTAATAALLLAAAPVASAHAQSTTKDSARADAPFVRQAIADNLVEVRLGEIAQHQATNQTVQKLAERMVTEHGRLQKQWMDLARKYGITISNRDTIGSKVQQRITRLRNAPKSSFDKQYVTLLLRAHAKDADMLRGAVDSVKSEPVKKLAAYELPIIQDHFLSVSAAAKEVGVDSTVVNASKKVAEE